MGALGESIGMFFWNILNRPEIKDWVDILIVAYLIYKLLLLTRETRASQVLKGLGVLFVASWVSNFFDLSAFNWILTSVVNNTALVLLILFQPELRRALEQIGRGAKLDRSQVTPDESARIVSELTQALLSLSRRRVGALVVFEQKTGLKDIADTGMAIDATISGALLINIFEPNTPLHDGAVIMRGTRIVAAACVLTLSDASNISRDLGTRHRAGLGISESTDAVVLIVSEETGIISMARAGKLTRHLDAEDLGRVLSNLYHDQRPTFRDALRAVGGRLWPGKQTTHDQ
ncbi:MAG: diadenylate cyclase CdaA [Christensenellales bacterium]